MIGSEYNDTVAVDTATFQKRDESAKTFVDRFHAGRIGGLETGITFTCGHRPVFAIDDRDMDVLGLHIGKDRLA